MSNITITTKKDLYGKWVAKSEVPLAGKQVLQIRTAKNNAGKVVTTASVCKVEIERGYRVERFTVFGDFYEVVYAVGGSRVTQKVVEEQQALVLQDLPFIRARVEAFYAQKVAA